jgi:hypothetical protein
VLKPAASRPARAMGSEEGDFDDAGVAILVPELRGIFLGRVDGEEGAENNGVREDGER